MLSVVIYFVLFIISSLWWWHLNCSCLVFQNKDHIQKLQLKEDVRYLTLYWLVSPCLHSGSHSGGFPEGAEWERAPGVPGGAQPAEGAAGRLQGRGQHEGEQQTEAGGPQGGSHKGGECFMESVTELPICPRSFSRSEQRTVLSDKKQSNNMSVSVFMLYVETPWQKARSGAPIW